MHHLFSTASKTDRTPYPYSVHGILCFLPTLHCARSRTAHPLSRQSSGTWCPSRCTLLGERTTDLLLRGCSRTFSLSIALLLRCTGAHPSVPLCRSYRD